MTEYILETKNLTKFFGENCAVYELNLKVPRGVVYGLLGPNGAGKSTAISMLTGCLKPSYGSVTILGLDIIKDRTKIMEKLGYLPQKPAAYPHITPVDFLVYMGRLSGMTRTNALDKTRELLDFVGLGKKSHYKVGTFSVGELQRLGFAQALINDPEILILDEPTSNLDPLGRFDLLNMVRRLVEEKGLTVITSSHIIPEVARVSDYIGILNNGVLLIEGDINDLVSGQEDEYVIEVSDNKVLADRLKEEGYVIEVSTSNEKNVHIKVDLSRTKELWKNLPRILADEKIDLYGFHPVGDPLERLFLKKLRVD